MVSVITAIVKLKGQRNVGKIGGTVLTFLLITTAIAALVGALTTAAFGLTTAGLEKGEAETKRAAALEESAAKVASDLPSQIAAFVPSNPFQDMTGARSTSTIAVVIFSGFVGFGILGVSKKRQDLFDRAIRGVDLAHDVVLEIVKIVLRLT
jgi:L-cystine uptake protein TcyP (sodium:dicarboxylate symporter family)